MSPKENREETLMVGPNEWPPQRLTVVYDDTCELCRRCRQWLLHEPTVVELEFLATSDPRIQERYGDYPWFQVELLVLDDHGRAWLGPDAFLMCLWATHRWRPMSFRLTGTAFAPLAERFFHALSANRSLVSGMLKPQHCDGDACAIGGAAHSITSNNSITSKNSVTSHGASSRSGW